MFYTNNIHDNKIGLHSVLCLFIQYMQLKKVTTFLFSCFQKPAMLIYMWDIGQSAN